jgi:hypothetical protein
MTATITIPAPAIPAVRGYNLDSLLPIVARRVHAGDFTSQCDIAKAYGLNKSTTPRWKQRALEMNLTNAQAWNAGLLLGRMNHILNRQ